MRFNTSRRERQQNQDTRPFETPVLRWPMENQTVTGLPLTSSEMVDSY